MLVLNISEIAQYRNVWKPAKYYEMPRDRGLNFRVALNYVNACNNKLLIVHAHWPATLLMSSPGNSVVELSSSGRL